MADRQHDRLYNPDDGYDRNGAPAKKADADPLAELARLIGQADPLSNFGRSQATPTAQPAARDRAAPAVDNDSPLGPPPWVQNRAAAQQPAHSAYDDHADVDLSAKPHPLHRYAQPAAAEAPPPAAYQTELPDHPAPPFAAEIDPQHQASDQYDDALYGQYDDPAHDPRQAEHAGYPDDAYAYADEYGDGAGPQERSKRRGGIMTVAAVLALAVVGTGAAFGYRTYIGSPRSGEPPVIKADVTPTKMVPPTTGDPTGKLIQDRLGPGNGAEQLVSREETPVDVKDPTKAGPRVVFPPLNQNANPPSTASVAPANKPLTPPPATPGDEPRKIRTLTVRGDQNDVAATPAAKPAPRAPAAPRAAAPTNANASSNAPLSLSPQAQQGASEPRTRIAAAPSAPAASGGGYVVQVASQRNEADAQLSFRALQGKYPSVLGSRSPLIKRADLGEKGVYYRAMVGPFSSPEEAAQMCGSLKTAGGQCVVQRN